MNYNVGDKVFFISFEKYKCIKNFHPAVKPESLLWMSSCCGLLNTIEEKVYVFNHIYKILVNGHYFDPTVIDVDRTEAWKRSNKIKKILNS